MNQHWMGGVRKAVVKATRHRKDAKQQRFFDNVRRQKLSSGTSAPFVSPPASFLSDKSRTHVSSSSYTDCSSALDDAPPRTPPSFPPIAPRPQIPSAPFAISIDLMSLTMTMGDELCEYYEKSDGGRHENEYASGSDYIYPDSPTGSGRGLYSYPPTFHTSPATENTYLFESESSRMTSPPHSDCEIDMCEEAENNNIRFVDEGTDRSREQYTEPPRTHSSGGPTGRKRRTYHPGMDDSVADDGPDVSGMLRRPEELVSLPSPRKCLKSIGPCEPPPNSPPSMNITPLEARLLQLDHFESIGYRCPETPVCYSIAHRN